MAAALLPIAGKFAMQVLPFLPGIASAVQGDYGKGAAQAATAYGIGRIPGVAGMAASKQPLQQAAALGLQTLGGGIGGGMVSDIAGAGIRGVQGLLGTADQAAQQRGQAGFLGPDVGTKDFNTMQAQALGLTRGMNEEQLRAMEAQYGITQKYAQATQQRLMQQVAQQAAYRGQLDRQAGAINLANAGMQQSAATQRALIQSSNPYVGKIF